MPLSLKLFLFLLFLSNGDTLTAQERPEQPTPPLTNFSSAAKDSLSPKTKIGIHGAVEIFQKKSYQNKSRYGFEGGFFFSKKVLERVTFAATLNGKFQSFDDVVSQVEEFTASDTAYIVHLFDLQREVFRLSFLLEARFYYSFDPGAYLLVGIGPMANITQKQKQQYRKTSYRNKFYKKIGEEIKDNVVLEPIEPQNWGWEFEIGTGINWKKYSLELLSRHYLFGKRWSSWALRIRRQIN